jgi:hypothetical protein
MLNWRIINLTIILTQLLVTGLAQHHKTSCGTQIPEAHVMGLQNITMPDDPECTAIEQVNRTLQISLHICHNWYGLTGVTQATIDNALNNLNEDFAPCGLQFAICAIIEMPNYEFDTLTVNGAINEEVHMTYMHYEPNTVNVYVVSSIQGGGMGDIDGYTYYPNTNNKDVIVLTKSLFGSTFGQFSHQMGHYLGLYHTHETVFGAEHPDGSNCLTAGDKICDTRADPGGDADHEDQCNYDGPTYAYAAGIWYVPPTDNLMSQYFRISPPSYECRCRFTPQQYNRMTYNYLTYRSYLW